MNSDRVLIIAVPLFVALFVHLVFLVVIEGEWTTEETAIVAKPQVIQASLVSLAEPKKSQPKPKPTTKPKSKPKPKPKAQPDPKSVSSSASVKSEPARPKSVDSEPPPSELSQAQRLRELQQELIAGLEQLPEPTALDSSVDEIDEVQQVAALMQARITQNWRRPPSARNGMEALLTISLVPTGDVVGINIASSSGSSAFDRSAIAAVERVARFPEVSVLSIADFERYFRQFPLRFRPEDLRY